MDLNKNIRSASSFLNAENVNCTGTIYAGVTTSSICFLHLSIAVLYVGKDSSLIFAAAEASKQTRLRRMSEEVDQRK